MALQHLKEVNPELDLTLHHGVIAGELQERINVALVWLHCQRGNGSLVDEDGMLCTHLQRFAYDAPRLLATSKLLNQPQRSVNWSGKW